MFNINGTYHSSILNDMKYNGLMPSHVGCLIFDGRIHRYTVIGDKLGSKNGWYVEVKIPNGPDIFVYGSWKKGVKHVWCSTNRGSPRLGSCAEVDKKISEAFKAFTKSKAKEHALAAKRAKHRLELSSPADPSHNYLVTKEIDPYTARQLGEYLVLAIIDCKNDVHNVEFIDPFGNKRLLAGGAKKGHFIRVQGYVDNNHIGITEGFATAGEIAKQFPFMCVVAAVDAGNMEPVALAIRKHNPDAHITIFGDDDRLTDGNPGATKARAAAVASGSNLCLPVWPEDAPNTLTDFNDLACWVQDKAKGEHDGQ